VENDQLSGGVDGRPWTP